MRPIHNSILPSKQQFALRKATAHEINYEAICIFVATGFFMDDDTYWKDQICLKPAHNHELNTSGELLTSTPNFEWHYSPRNITFEQVLEEYIGLLTTIIKEQVKDHPVILPLSGGLDSRSQAMVLKELNNNVHSYSYAFPGGYPEHKISEKIAKYCGFSFDAFFIGKGYLWNSIDELADLNKCYSEFTHSRQMAILDELKAMNGVFSLGHWGDVLFDRGVPEGTESGEVVLVVLKKMLKPGGLELANKLWEAWGLDGQFKDYLIGRVETALSQIKIDNLSAKVRAFKTSQWAHRWTTTNLSIFEEAAPITLPYYDNRMIEFICSIPEEYLADRKLQISHIRKDATLSNIVWHQNKPFNLNTYHKNKAPYNLPYRVFNKMKREFNNLVGNPYIQRNFEIQFMGKDNDQRLYQYLMNMDANGVLPKSVVEYFYQKFKSPDYVYYSHPISMLLTLSVWQNKNHIISQ
ncbi:asparagine synthase-related protein [Psychroserpens sp.]|uniref:asparagine synthase-related protein n=1 Tax=Psychroserpens sp. TaxID=2020870 RepID=UPI002AA8D2A3|nr:asparagine synthase-related protein [Psychroserpens sp.]